MAVINIDEFYFHVKRGLPKWERIGHPLDTLTVLACFAFILIFPYSSLNLKIYIGLALFSCVFVTKDEFVHKECCPASEQWLHAPFGHALYLYAGRQELLTENYHEHRILQEDHETTKERKHEN